jgi:hypothetical protein
LRALLTRDRSALARLAPLLAGLLGAVAALVGAATRGLPLPLDVAGVFLALGLATTWIARATPWRGALFLLTLAAIVVGTVYGG